MTTDKKVWFITGCSKGLGKSLTETILKAGHIAVVTSRSKQSLVDLVDAWGTNVYPIQLNVSDPIQIKHVVDDVMGKFGRIDFLVNNAGYGYFSSLEDASIHEFQQQFEVNFYGAMYLTKAVVPIMREQGSGHIFQISSQADRCGAAGLSAYHASKWALCGFSLSVAREVAPFGVRITVVEPGGMRTEWAKSSLKKSNISEPYQGTVGKFLGFMNCAADQLPSYPDKVAQIIVQLSEMGTPPERILLGIDAVADSERISRELYANDAKWRDLSLRTV